MRQPSGPRARETESAEPPASQVVFGTIAILVVLLGIVGALGFILLRQGDEGPPAKPAGLTGSTLPRVPVNTSYVRSIVTDSGDLLVTHLIRSDALLFSVRLSAPDLSAYGLAARAKNLEVVVDGRVLPGPKRVAERPVKFPFVSTNDVEISYLLTGVVERSNSAEGRALVRIAALDVGYEPRPKSTERAIEGTRILSLACWGRRPAELRPCGGRFDGGWRVRLTGAKVDNRVMVQLDLG